MLDKLGKHPLFTRKYTGFPRRLRPPVHTQKQGVVVAFDAKQRALTVSKPGFAKVKGVAGYGEDHHPRAARDQCPCTAPGPGTDPDLQHYPAALHPRRDQPTPRR